MNRRRKLLIPLLFCGAMLTACDDKSAENAAAMTPEVGVVTLSPGSVNVLSELPGRTVPYEVAEIRPQVGGIIIKRNFIDWAGGTLKFLQRHDDRYSFPPP